MDRIIPTIKYSYYNAIKTLYEIAKYYDRAPIIISIADRVIRRNRLDKHIFTDNLHYLMYKTYFKGYPVYVGVAKNYLLVDNIIFVYSKNEWYYNKRYIPNTRAYIDRWIFGINSDNKIFINHIFRHYGVEILEYVNEYDKEHNTIYIEPKISPFNDSNIQEYEFGYSYDCENREEIILVEGGTYRVQGDIVFSFGLENIDNLVNHIVLAIIGNMSNQIYGVYNTYVYINVEQFLRKLGFSIIEHNRLTDTIIQIVIPGVSTYKNENARVFLEKALYNFINYDLGYSVNVNVSMVKPRLSRHYNIEITISHNTPYMEFEIAKYALKTLREYVKNLVDNNVYKTYTVYHGNHIIKIDSIPLEYSVEIPKEINPLKQIYPENDLVLSANIRNDRRFYVLPSFKAIIQHYQHGITNITFNNYGIVDIENTRTSELYPNFQNIIAFKNMINQLLNKNNNKNNRKITEYINGVE